MIRLMRTATVAAVVAASGAIAAQSAPPTTQTPPVPRPFPGTAQPPAPAGQATASLPAPQPPPAGSVDAYLFPNAEFIDSFDAGRGQQRYYLYGTNTPYLDVVAHYRTALKGAGNREVLRTPPIHQFDLGRYQEESMAYPPSVVVKDYTWNGSQGYLHVAGTTEKRYRTIVQIVLVK